MEFVWLASSEQTVIDSLNMAARLISVAGKQRGFLGVRNIISVILRLQDFVTNRPCPISLMLQWIYVRLKMGGNIPFRSTPENDDFCAVVSLSVELEIDCLNKNKIQKH